VRLDEVPGDMVARLKAEPALKKHYLPISRTTTGRYAILRRRVGRDEDITVRDLAGRRFLSLSPNKPGSTRLPELLAYYGGLFILCSISRYHPRVWTDYVRGTSVLELQLVRRFLDLCARRMPNLVLDFIEDREHIFTAERVVDTVRAPGIDSEKIERIVDRKLGSAPRRLGG
jgi:hypothetical protein